MGGSEGSSDTAIPYQFSWNVIGYLVVKLGRRGVAMSDCHAVVNCV